MPPADSELIAEYLAGLAHARRLSEHTLRSYAHELEMLVQLAQGRTLASLSATDMRGAVARAHAGGLSARSIAHRLSAWRAFYRAQLRSIALFGARVRGIVDLREVLKIQRRIDLRRSHAGVTEQFLDRTQIAARLQ